MTRLEEHKQKVFYQKVALMVGILILLIAFIFFVGFQFILKSSGYVGNLSSKSDSLTPQADNFYGTLDLDELPSATNSASFIISGSVTNFDTVQFFINEKKIQSSSVDSKGTFNKTVSGLEKGKNEVYVKALTSDQKHSKTSDTYTIHYKSDKPKIEISEPGDNSKTDHSEIKVMGKTDPDVSVKINNSPVVVDSQQQFQQIVNLKEGENKIDIWVQDDAGNSDQKELTVTYKKD
jgi:hypothetical protein